jgi:hypothetical protein
MSKSARKKSKQSVADAKPDQMKGVVFDENMGLGNQLVVLYHVYNTFPNVEDLFFPKMDSCRHYFNCDKFRSGEYYRSNHSKFRHIVWGDAKDAGDLIRFSDLQLTPEHQAKVDSMVEGLGGGDLVAVHMRHGDYDHWNDGKFYFSAQKHLDETYKDGVNFSWDITGGEAVYDLFFMSHFNYFVRTYSTYSGVASRLSQNRGLFKGEVVVSD